MIDGSVLELNGGLYFLFSAFGPRQSVYIAPMNDPWTLGGQGVADHRARISLGDVGGDGQRRPGRAPT
jgi:hypothetical protein